MNEFQWANALDNVYFRPDADPARWVPDRHRLNGLRRDEHVSVSEDDVRIEGTKRVKIIRVQTQRPSRALKMPLFRNRIDPPPLLDVGMLPLRKPDWALHVHRMTDALSLRTISPEEFDFRTIPPQFLQRILREKGEQTGGKKD